MSSIPPAATDPTPPAGAPASAYQVETAPSAVVAEGPTFSRIVGFVGLFFLVLGAVVVIATRVTGTARIVPEGYGFLFFGLGVVLMLYHAVADPEPEVRRMYGGLAAVLLVLAVLSAVVPGPFVGAGSTDKRMGYFLLPWGVAVAMLALLFAIPFIRHETDETARGVAVHTLLVVGGLLCVGVLVWGVIRPDFLAGTGLALALVGLAFVCAYLGQVETAEGVGYVVAFVLGAVGAAAALYVLGRAVFPTVLYEGPSVLRKANQSLDYWKVAGRVLVIAAFLAVSALSLWAIVRAWVWLVESFRQLKEVTFLSVLWVVGNFLLRHGAAVLVFLFGLAGAGVFILASFKSQVTTPPAPFLVPGGVILAGLGLTYLAVALGICSDSQLVTLTRRELSSYFLSPIGYLVLGGMAAAQWVGYWEFIARLDRVSAGGRGAFPEPIVQIYIVALFPVLALTLQVPALTMRLLAEEKRTGSLEVLFTAPVSEWVVVLSKFFATWIFFMVSWLPAGLFLIVLRMEGGSPFDYRPLLGFYVALAATGAGFIAMGLFISSLTNNQIVAAVITFVGMIGFLACYIFKDRNIGLGKTGQLILAKLSYIDLWAESLSGQLPVRDVLLWLSLAVFFLFLSIKVLETRRWS